VENALVVKQQTDKKSSNHQVTMPSVKADCVQTNLPLDLNSALPVQIDHPLIHSSDTALPLDELFEPPTHAIQVSSGDEENGIPQEYGGGLYDPNSRIFLGGTTSTGGSDSIEPPLSFERTSTTDLNDGLPYDPTLPRLLWHPKISPYRFMVLSIPLAIGTVKAVFSHEGSLTTPITLEWISGVMIILV
jgi:hypothetical protein